MAFSTFLLVRKLAFYTFPLVGNLLSQNTEIIATTQVQDDNMKVPEEKKKNGENRHMTYMETYLNFLVDSNLVK